MRHILQQKHNFTTNNKKRLKMAITQLYS